MGIRIIIGKNYGDEGKGFATDFFANRAQKDGKRILAVRHNGGAQAGHTVDTDGKRFIFHQLSSGSFRDAVTLWSDTYLPDLYKISGELKEFKTVSGKNIDIIGADNCRCVLIYDVLLNMAFEKARNDKRHGSCGMGINEAVERSANINFELTLGQLKGMTADSLAAELRRTRNDYVPLRIRDMGFEGKLDSFYADMFEDDNIPENTAQVMAEAAEKISTVSDMGKLFNEFDEIVFEGAQGLLLDSQNTADAPHITSSRTGLYNPIGICRKYLRDIKPEIIYVTRSYVTRHGEGPLPCEKEWDRLRYCPGQTADMTNIPNEWQGKLRYAPHQDEPLFFAGIKKDLEEIQKEYGNLKPDIKKNEKEYYADKDFDMSLMITHLNETGGKIAFKDRMYTTEEFLEFPNVKDTFSKIYCSHSRYADQVQELKTVERDIS